MPLQFQPMPLQRRATAFDDPDWIYELKMDGFRALAIVEHGRAQLLSRNGHPFSSFSALAESISDSLPNVRTVIDGEICSLDDAVNHSSKICCFTVGIRRAFSHSIY